MIDSLTSDCYENTSVLINKFNIRDENKLSVMEQSITSVMIAKAIMEIPFENVDFEFYKNLHKFVFSDIYEWAGCPRKVDMSKKLNFADIDKDLLMIATIKSVSGDVFMLRDIFKEHIR